MSYRNPFTPPRKSATFDDHTLAEIRRAAATGITPEAAKNQLIGEKQPQLQFTTPEQLGAFAVFLCSPAASNMQGAQLVSDGGWTAQ